MNIWDILILLAVAAALALAVFSARRRRKSGEGCCGSCEGCALRGSCSSGSRKADQP